MLDADTLARRLRAARELRALDQAELEPLLEEEGYGKHDAARMERKDDDAPVLHEGRRRAFARIFNLPEAWFSAPDEELFLPPAEDRLGRIELHLKKLTDAVREIGRENITTLAEIRESAEALRAEAARQGSREAKRPKPPRG